MQMSPEKKEEVLNRLRRIAGHVRGIQRMIEDDRYCGDILSQFASVQQALRGASGMVARTALETCVTDSLLSGSPEAAESTYDAYMRLLRRPIGLARLRRQ